MPKKYADKAVTQIRIDATLYAEIREIADRESRSINSQIEHFLKRAVSQYKALAPKKSDTE